jgi:hypothetical protein
MTRSMPVLFIPGCPGEPDTVEEARENPESIADHRIDDVVEHYTKIIRGLTIYC